MIRIAAITLARSAHRCKSEGIYWQLGVSIYDAIPKNLLRLFFRNRLASQKTLKNLQGYFLLVLKVFFWRVLRKGASFFVFQNFGIEISFMWYRGGLSLLFGIEISFFWYRDSAFWCSASKLSSSWDQSFFWASTSCKMEIKEDLDTKKKIKESRYPKKTSRYQLKESPLKK